MDLNTVMSMNVADLRAKLTELGLDSNGLKKVLQDRLLRHFGLHARDDNVSENSEYEDIMTPANRFSGSFFTLRDIADSVSTFSGTDSLDVRQWIEEFEDNAETVGWNSIQKFIYAKQLLKGAAKLFVRSQAGLKDWNSLRQALISEFGESLSAIEVHKLLRSRRKKDNESYREYLYSLMEIGKTVNLDVASLLEYFIEGIPDSRINKTVLYQAKTVEEMKDQIKIYEKTRPKANNDNRKSSTNNKVVKVEEKVSGQKKKNCFKCGNNDHLAKDCTEKQFKCFKCNGFGHRAFECSGRKAEVKQEPSNVNMIAYDKEPLEPGLKFKQIVLGDITLYALIDTGCNICIVRHDIYDRLTDLYNLVPEQRRMRGAGSGQFYTQGYFDAEIVIDGIKAQNIRFFVVRGEDIEYPAILGNSLLNHVDLVVTQEGVKCVPKLVVGPKVEEVASDTVGLLSEFGNLCLNFEEEVTPTVELEHLKRHERDKVLKMIVGYEAKEKADAPVSMKILVKDDIPVAQRPRRVSYQDQKIVDQQISEWLDKGIIRPSTSEYASPVVLVPKKDGTKRLCCDYRKLNEKIIRDNFPIALIDDVLERLQSANVYTTLDLKDGFFHVPMDPDSTKYTAFVTQNGQYEFLFVAFGISNSPAVFCRFINAIFRDLMNKGIVVVYMDDVIIPSKDEAEGIEKLVMVLKVAEENGLHIRWKKCQFLQRSVNFLGYIVEN